MSTPSATRVSTPWPAQKWLDHSAVELRARLDSSVQTGGGVAHVLVRAHPVVSHASNQWWCAHFFNWGGSFYTAAAARAVRTGRTYGASTFPAA